MRYLKFFGMKSVVGLVIAWNRFSENSNYFAWNQLSDKVRVIGNT